MHRGAFQKWKTRMALLDTESFSSVPSVIPSSSFPAAGEHTDEILEQYLLFSREEILELHQNQVIGSTQK